MTTNPVPAFPGWPADPDPAWSRELEEFHRQLREETDRLVGGPLPEYRDDDPELRGAGVDFDNMVREASAELRRPDRVPVIRQPTDWSALGNLARGSGFRFRSVEFTDDGVNVIDQPVALAVPLGVEYPTTPDRPRPATDDDPPQAD